MKCKWCRSEIHDESNIKTFTITTRNEETHLLNTPNKEVLCKKCSTSNCVVWKITMEDGNIVIDPFLQNITERIFNMPENANWNLIKVQMPLFEYLTLAEENECFI
jgi:hypothetical protein